MHTCISIVAFLQESNLPSQLMYRSCFYKLNFWNKYYKYCLKSLPQNMIELNVSVHPFNKAYRSLWTVFAYYTIYDEFRYWQSCVKDVSWFLWNKYCTWLAFYHIFFRHKWLQMWVYTFCEMEDILFKYLLNLFLVFWLCMQCSIYAYNICWHL